MLVLADAAARRRTSRYPEIELIFSINALSCDIILKRRSGQFCGVHRQFA